MKAWKCGGYERLSQADFLKKDESSSIESQRLIIKSFCSFNKMELVEEYVDDGYSGGNFDRPNFKRMISDIEAGKINCVITKDLSRLGREIYETGNYIEDYFAQKNIRYIAINDGYDSLNGDSMLPVRLSMNDYVLRDGSKKVITSLRERQRAGKYIGSFPRYGYLKDKLDHHHLVPDPKASIIVRRIFKMALAGNSPNKIAHQLTIEKIPIPIVYKREPRAAQVKENDGYGIWKPQTIRDILKSEMYIGNMVQNICNKIRYNSKKKRSTPRDEYIIKEGTHEPIIDKETFYKVNEMLASRSKTYDYKTDKYLFSGLLKCKECGHSIGILEKKNKKNNAHYTQCNLYAKKGKYGLCTIHRVNYNLLEEDLINIIRTIGKTFIEEYDNESLTEEANEIYMEEINHLQKEIDKIQFSIEKTNRAIEELYTDKIEGNIPKEIFGHLLTKYNDTLKSDNSQKDMLENEKIELSSKLNALDYDRCSQIVKEFLKMKAPSRALIVELIDKVEIDENKNVEIFFKFNELSTFIK